MTRSRKLGLARGVVFALFVAGLFGPSSPLPHSISATGRGDWVAALHIGLWITLGATCVSAVIRGGGLAAKIYLVCAWLLLLEVLLLWLIVHVKPSFPEDWGVFAYSAALGMAVFGEIVIHRTDPARQSA